MTTKMATTHAHKWLLISYLTDSALQVEILTDDGSDTPLWILATWFSVFEDSNGHNHYRLLNNYKTKHVSPTDLRNLAYKLRKNNQGSVSHEVASYHLEAAAVELEDLLNRLGNS